MTSREKILEAAVKVFATKGRHGAKMEEIAKEASINKAMIYYIFHSKDELYLDVLKKIFSNIFGDMIHEYTRSQEQGLSPTEVLIGSINWMFRLFSNDHNFARIMIDAISNGAEEVPLVIKHCKSIYGDDCVKIEKRTLEKGIAEGTFRPIDSDQFNISIQGIIMIFFLSVSMTEVLDIEINDYDAFLEKRRLSIIDLVLNGILVKKA